MPAVAPAVEDVRISRMTPELSRALAAVRAAQDRLNYAEGQEMVDAAIFELQAAEIRAREALRRARTA